MRLPNCSMCERTFGVDNALAATQTVEVPSVLLPGKVRVLHLCAEHAWQLWKEDVKARAIERGSYPTCPGCGDPWAGPDDCPGCVEAEAQRKEMGL